MQLESSCRSFKTLHLSSKRFFSSEWVLRRLRAFSLHNQCVSTTMLFNWIQPGADWCSCFCCDICTETQQPIIQGMKIAFVFIMAQWWLTQSVIRVQTLLLILIIFYLFHERLNCFMLGHCVQTSFSHCTVQLLQTHHHFFSSVTHPLGESNHKALAACLGLDWLWSMVLCPTSYSNYAHLRLPYKYVC